MTEGNPFADPMTPRQEAILNLGWDVMKHQNCAHLFIWLAADGWEGGN